MPKIKPFEKPEPVPEPEVPSGSIMATARAFNPVRVGWPKTAMAIGIVVANAVLYLAIEKGWVAAGGMFTIFLAQVFGLLTGGALRHLGSRWATADDS